MQTTPGGTASRTVAQARLHTPICKRLGIEFPGFQAGMGWVACGELAAAVSAAGGLGTIGAGSTMTPEELREQIQLFRTLLTPGTAYRK